MNQIVPGYWEQIISLYTWMNHAWNECYNHFEVRNLAILSTSPNGLLFVYLSNCNRNPWSWKTIFIYYFYDGKGIRGTQNTIWTLISRQTIGMRRQRLFCNDKHRHLPSCWTATHFRLKITKKKYRLTRNTIFILCRIELETI